MSRRVAFPHLAIVAALIAACARAAYTCVNELDVPGACHPDTVKHGTFAITADSLIAGDSIVGYVVAQFSRVPVQNVRVIITSDTSFTLLTDSSGRFSGPRPDSHSWIVQARMIGYRPRVDTVSMGTTPTRWGTRFRIGIETQGLDGPCSGFAMICGKRP